MHSFIPQLRHGPPLAVALADVDEASLVSTTGFVSVLMVVSFSILTVAISMKECITYNDYLVSTAHSCTTGSIGHHVISEIAAAG